MPGSKINFGVFSQTGQLDPTLVAGGVVGGSEIAALYDVLFTYDDTNNKVVPHLATSIEPNATFTEFTLKLRDGVKFSDGTPFDAQMVADNFERWKGKETTAPQGALLRQFMGATQVVDPTTLKITMNSAWAEFPAFLAEQVGMVVNTKVAGADRKAFAAAPPDAAGVGPYVLERNAPGEEIVFKARKDYWGGPVCVETLRIVWVPGAPGTFEAFQAGELDVAYSQDPAVNAEVEAAGIKAYFKPNDIGQMLLLNLRPGFVGNDIRLREAIWRSIDANKVNQQVYNGKQHISNSLIHPESVWGSADLKTVDFDLDRAKQLIAEAKADGVDVKIDVIGDTTQPQTDTYVAWTAMLQAAGFEVNLQPMPLGEKIPQIFQGKFEATGWALSIEPAEIVTRLYGAIHSGATNNRGDYKSPEMDAALESAMAAPASERAKAVAKINDIWVNDYVTPVFTNLHSGIMWQDKVHDVITAPTNIFLFHRAYVD